MYAKMNEGYNFNWLGFISCLNYTLQDGSSNPSNVAQVDINITVPADEASGTKTATMTFTGSVAY